MKRSRGGTARRLVPPIALLGTVAAVLGLVVVLAVLGVPDWIVMTSLGTAVVLGIGWWIFVAGARTDSHGRRPPVRLSQKQTQSELLASGLLVAWSFTITSGKHGTELDRQIPYLALMGVAFWFWSMILATARSKAARRKGEMAQVRRRRR